MVQAHGLHWTQATGLMPHSLPRRDICRNCGARGAGFCVLIGSRPGGRQRTRGSALQCCGADWECRGMWGGPPESAASRPVNHVPQDRDRIRRAGPGGPAQTWRSAPLDVAESARSRTIVILSRRQDGRLAHALQDRRQRMRLVARARAGAAAQTFTEIPRAVSPCPKSRNFRRGPWAWPWACVTAC